MIFYGLKNCDTCRKTLKALKDMGQEVTFCEVRSDGVATADLKAALAGLGAGKVVNTRSTTWRDLSESERAKPPLELLQAHPALMKRPLLVGEGWLSVGWSAAIETDLEAWQKRP